MPHWMIGCFIPKSSVIRVLIVSVSYCEQFSGDLQIAAEVMVGGAELNVDGRQPLKIPTDLQLVAHAHATVDLHCLLADELRCLAYLHLGAGDSPGALTRVASEGQSGEIAHRQCLLVSNEHVDHPVLQH